jgi:predicted glycogen debranching enzyme
LNSAIVVYARPITSDRASSLTLDVRPLLSLRPHQSLRAADEPFDAAVRPEERGFLVIPEDGLPLQVSVSRGRFTSDPHWYRRQTYAWETRRGLEDKEDVYGPGFFSGALATGESIALVFSVENRDAAQAEVWEKQERDLRARLFASARVRGPLADRLILAADQFLVSRGEGLSVMGGYPWFEDGAREALIALPGLTLATGRTEDAASVLETYALHIRRGRLPTRFGDGVGGSTGDGPGTLAFEAADTALWFVRAVQAYFAATLDESRLRRWFPILREIVEVIEHGAPSGPAMDRDGLVTVPAEPTPLTWMDARTSRGPATPRGGKPVEIQALWYNALQFLKELELKFGEPPRGYDKLADVARKSFNDKFWNATEGTLYDVVDGKERDPSLRPNALLAAGLPYEILEADRFKPLVDTAERELVTSHGLRTLAPRDPAYRGTYDGPPAERDARRHQGAVWPWLWGPFLTVFVKAHGPSDDTKARVLQYLAPLRDLSAEAGLGSLPEIAEGEPPHEPRGCPFFAPSVGEVLRVMWEEGVSL